MIERFWLPSVDAAQLDELAKYLLRLRKTDPGVVKTNVGGWHSSNIQTDRELAPFATGILAGARKLTGEPRLATHIAWANVNESGDHMTMHTHGGRIRVALFMVQPALPGGVDEGSFMYEDPTTNGKMIAINPPQQAGEVALFSGDMPHKVTAHHQSAPRITVAFNLCTTK
jgi:hypothetical protein